jgi:hypothetical protein
LKHFPKVVLSSHSISTQHPDDFVCDLIVADRDRAVLAFAADRARMVNPPHSVAEYIAGIETGGMKKSAAMLLERQIYCKTGNDFKSLQCSWAFSTRRHWLGRCEQRSVNTKISLIGCAARCQCSATPNTHRRAFFVHNRTSNGIVGR